MNEQKRVVLNVQLEIKEDEIKTMKEDVKWLEEMMQEEIQRGSYDQAAQWAGKIQALASKVDATQRDLKSFKSMLKALGDFVDGFDS